MTDFSSPLADVPLRDQTITERVFEGLAGRESDDVLIDGPTGRAMTGGQFVDQVKALAGGLRDLGVAPGSVVAIMAPNSPDYCVVFHAVAWAGGTITTLNPTYGAAEIRHQLRDSRAGLMVAFGIDLAVIRDGIADTGVTRIVTRDGADGTLALDDLMADPLAAQVPVDLDAHTVVLPYSSGTTGLPKGVMLSHRNLVVNCDQVIAAAGFQAGETAAGFLPFFHIYGMTVLMNVHLAGGGTVVTMPRFDLALFLQICQDHRARRMWIVPPVALALAKHPIVDDYDLTSVEQTFSGAAPMGADLSRAVAARLDCVSLQGYGMTELSPVTHVTPVDAAREGASGLTVPNTTCRIVDPETGRALGPDEEGELWIRGPQVMQGYLNNDAATAATIVEGGWLRTGDIARFDADGYMTVVDRLKELIKVKGFQVAPAELEAALVAIAGVTDAAVIGQADEESGEVPVAFLVVAEDGPADEAIIARLRDSLASYKQLRAIHRVDAIPKSASGKILRRVLRDRLAG